jgi:hypothetical protein
MLWKPDPTRDEKNSTCTCGTLDCPSSIYACGKVQVGQADGLVDGPDNQVLAQFADSYKEQYGEKETSRFPESDRNFSLVPASYDGRPIRASNLDTQR